MNNNPQPQYQESFNTSFGNNGGYSSASALQIRLDNQIIIENIELFLKGSKLIAREDSKGKVTTQTLRVGLPKANDIGISAILNYVQSMINPQVVQGNFPINNAGRSPMYDSYVYECHVDMATFMVINCYDWEIVDEDIPVICDFIMKLVIPFISRLIDNKERESYESTIRHVESNTIREGNESKGFNLFGGGRS